MSRPRQVLPGQFYLLTRRCTQRQFLLRPDEETNNAFVYCLGEAAQRYEIDIVLPTAMSNHHHTVLFDRHGRYPQFTEHFHKMLARCMNARWGRWENLWAAEEVCITRLLDRDTIIEKLVYAAANPVKDLLVERADQWPGANGYRHLVHRKAMSAQRPRHFFRESGRMPKTVTLRLVIPPELGDADSVIDEIQNGVASVERAMIEHRAISGARILGRRGVLAQSWRASPTSVEPRRNLRPRFAGATPMRVQALIAYKEFLATYRDARAAWRERGKALFPHGTYWLARFTPASVESLSS
jgi:hypothetical protein